MLANWLYYHPGTLTSMFNSSSLRNSNVLNAWTIVFGFIGNSLINLFIILPWTRQLMYKRHKLEREEGKSYTDANASSEMKSLTSQFGAAHGTSSVVNLAYLGALMFHSAWLATYGF
ncbi:MAG: hypothetical protein CYPHOPRED_000279 [Cyphobasidiales sp. Tagirdzhanova-0007]|nr:MAG: hypothetical protein CYPHOPRED_000279 [Cyphobasidiales sp. Tagirdzhanova-0007]